MADAKGALEFFEGRVGMLADAGVEFLGIEFSPVAPARFGGQPAGLGGGQIPVNGASAETEAPGGFNLGTALFDELDHPFPQIQRIGFHAS
jgi:hypothetical protein